MIRLENVHKSFGNLEVLKGINLHVKEGEKLVIIGPSGSGKSTLIRCMNCLEEVTSGDVYVHNHHLTKKYFYISKAACTFIANICMHAYIHVCTYIES